MDEKTATVKRTEEEKRMEVLAREKDLTKENC